MLNLLYDKHLQPSWRASFDSKVICSSAVTPSIDKVDSVKWNSIIISIVDLYYLIFIAIRIITQKTYSINYFSSDMVSLIQMNLYKSIVAFSALAFLIGCTPKEEESLPAAPSNGGAAVAVQATQDASAPPPVAPPPVAPAANAGGAPAPAGTTSGTTAAFGNIDGDPLAYYRYDSEARKLDDLGALQNAIAAYGRTVGQTFTSEDAPKPPLTKLEELVTFRVLRGIPAPPSGKRYVFDAATQKVTLENN